MKIKLQKIVGNLLEMFPIYIARERNGHLEISSRPEVIENSRQYLLLRTDILLTVRRWVPLCLMFHVSRTLSLSRRKISRKTSGTELSYYGRQPKIFHREKATFPG